MISHKRNVYDLLTLEQIKAMLDLLESGISELTDHLTDDDGYYSAEDVERNEAKIALAQQAYELIAGDVYPQHATPRTLAQLDILDIRNGEWSTAEIEVARTSAGDLIDAAARDVLGYLGEEGGTTPGHFVRSLLTAFTQADDVNTGRLATMYPAYAAAWHHYKRAGADGLRSLLAAKIQ